MVRSILTLALVLLFAGCNENNNSAMKDFYKVYGGDLGEISAAMEKIAARKVYFGHQSVGYNILDGIEQLEKETNVAINKVETRDLSNTDGYSMVHFRVGKNKDPFSKIEDFENMVMQIPKDESSVAFFKFCYIDFHHSADVDAIFKAYKERMLAIRDSSENCRIILCTTPLTALQKGPKALAKKILGKPLNNSRENIKRNAFNEKVRTELGDEFPVFDLAKVESTLPDGSLYTFKYNGVNYPRLQQSYTNDGGHLSLYGARSVAYNLIAFLSEEIDN